MVEGPGADGNSLRCLTGDPGIGNSFIAAEGGIGAVRLRGDDGGSETGKGDFDTWGDGRGGTSASASACNTPASAPALVCERKGRTAGEGGGDGKVVWDCVSEEVDRFRAGSGD